MVPVATLTVNTAPEMEEMTKAAAGKDAGQNDPGGHGVHVARPAALYVAAPHCAGRVLVPTHENPAGQSIPAVEFEPAGQKLPGGAAQLTHAAPADEYCPALHAVHEFAPAVELEPAGHGVH